MSDLIDRQAAIELIKNYCENGCDIAKEKWCPSCQQEQFIELLKDLPSAQPKQGHWIKHKWAEEVNEMLIPNYECSECHYWERYDSNFCPNCGADMRGEQDE